MKYFPDLIPKTSKVLPGYFKGSMQERKAKNKVVQAIYAVAGVLFSISAFLHVRHFLLFLLPAALGFVLIPPGHLLIEKMLRFELTNKIKLSFTSLLLLIILPVYAHYSTIDLQLKNAEAVRLATLKRQEERTEKLNQLRMDSLAYFLKKVDSFNKAGNLKLSEKLINQSYKLCASAEERQQVDKRQTEYVFSQAAFFLKAGEYKASLEQLEALSTAGHSSPEIAYSKAVCLSKLGRNQEAVAYLKPLVQTGDYKAQRLYDKVNPIRRSVAGYVTRCCDGSTSNARGRGACSWHGGVCNWNEPVYTESRQYE